MWFVFFHLLLFYMSDIHNTLTLKSALMEIGNIKKLYSLIQSGIFQT